jgi:hypothetical protein
MRPRWSPAELALLHSMYPDCHSADVAAWLGRSEPSVHGQAALKRIQKSAEFRKSSASGRIDGGGRAFNWQPIGSHRINASGCVCRKVADTGYSPVDWRPLHRLVWEAAHGPVPPGHVARFKAGLHTTNPDAITLDRVECVPLAVHGATAPHLPLELRRLTQLKGAITRHVRRIERQEKP